MIPYFGIYTQNGLCRSILNDIGLRHKSLLERYPEFQRPQLGILQSVLSRADTQIYVGRKRKALEEVFIAISSN
jgi:hypothetical protein